MRSLRLSLFLLIIFVLNCANARVRSVEVNEDQIVTIKTALGVATLIQVPERPNNLIVGNSDAFKIEYLDQAITIKPLHHGARSNLYIYTEVRRYSVQLVTVPDTSADYVVYLKPLTKSNRGSDQRITWTRFQNSLKNESVTLETTRIGKTRDGAILLDFKINSSQSTEIDPAWFWLTQAGESRPIHRLLLSSTKAGFGEPIEGVIEILQSDLQGNHPIRLELRRRRVSYLTLPEVSTWR